MKYRILGVAVLFLSFHLPALAQGQGQRPNLNPGEGQAGGGRGRGGPVTPPRHTPIRKVRRGPGAGPNALRYPNPKYSQVPFQQWARALLDYRLDNAFEPHTRCKPSG